MPRPHYPDSAAAPVPTSPSESRSRLTRALTAVTASLLLAACDKSETPTSAEVPLASVPTSAMSDVIPPTSTAEHREALISELVALARAAQGSGELQRIHFSPNPEKPTNWRLAWLTLQFWPGYDGTHIVMVRAEGEGTGASYEILDANSDGYPDTVEHSVFSPSPNASPENPLTRFVTDYTVNDDTIKMYEAGLEQALKVLKSEQEWQKAWK